MSIQYTDEERATVTYVPRTTSEREGSRFDVQHRARSMKDGAFAVQLVGSIPRAKYMRRISQADAATLEREPIGYLSNSWDEIKGSHGKGDHVTGEVVKHCPFGVFVELDGTSLLGLISK